MKASSYPDEYRKIFDKALTEPVRLQFTTANKARAFRAELYHYRYAVRDELPRSKELYDRLMLVELRIKTKVLTLSKKKSKFVEKLNDR